MSSDGITPVHEESYRRVRAAGIARPANKNGSRIRHRGQCHSCIEIIACLVRALDDSTARRCRGKDLKTQSQASEVADDETTRVAHDHLVIAFMSGRKI